MNSGVQPDWDGMNGTNQVGGMVSISCFCSVLMTDHLWINISLPHPPKTCLLEMILDSQVVR